MSPFVDQVIVTDTGSIDQTPYVATSLGALVYRTDWEDSFAAACQTCFSHATTDWLFWLDADELVRNARLIVPYLSSIPDDVGVIWWPMEWPRDARGNTAASFPRERCFRRANNIEAHGRVHTTFTADGRHVEHKAVVVEHHPYEKPRLERNTAILEREIAEEGESGRRLYYLGRDLAGLGENDRAIKALLRAADIHPWVDERVQALCLVASIYRSRGEYTQAEIADQRARTLLPHWPDGWWGLLRTYYFTERWDDACAAYDIAKDLKQPETRAVVSPLNYTLGWRIYAANALYRVGRIREALAVTNKALEIDPDDVSHRQNATFFRSLID